MAEVLAGQDPVEPTTEEIFRVVAPVVEKFWALRNAEYRGSWCKHGLLGAVLNLFRKTDRLEVWMRLGGPTPVPVDTIFDTAAYSLAILAWVVKNRPPEFTAWAKKQLGDYPSLEGVMRKALELSGKFELARLREEERPS